MVRYIGFLLWLLLAGCQGAQEPAPVPDPEPEAPLPAPGPQPFENEVISVPVSPLTDMSGDAWENGH
ncbi:hypothetical protein [Zobellella maritima]|uniref:hypothetical protein n=1 Tax=Zobellella maritima TaxID=2059725 RepID=UPI000E307E86|nr:hypothetical protein [Zobellella maritima]